jgi:hypothetical protein
MSRLKEALLILKGGKYKISHPSDKMLIDEYLGKEGETERLLENLECLYTDPAFQKFKKHLRCMKAFMLLVAALFTLYIILFIISMITTLSPGSLDTYEILYLGFCAMLIIFFILIMYMGYTEAKVFRGCRQPILQKIKNMLGEEFSTASFNINIDRHMTIRARPTSITETKLDAESLDYYDFINKNNPEDEDYYRGHNPYDLDPHEKNLLADAVAQREKDLNKASKSKHSIQFRNRGKADE